MQAVTSPAAAAFISERGGSVYVWARKFNCCGGPVRVVCSSTELPGGLTGFRHLEAGGYQVMFHPSAGPAPAQIEVRLRGRRRPRISAYWDGMPV